MSAFSNGKFVWKERTRQYMHLYDIRTVFSSLIVFECVPTSKQTIIFTFEHMHRVYIYTHLCLGQLLTKQHFFE